MSEKYLTKWDIESHSQLVAFRNPTDAFNISLSSDDKKILFNGSGANVWDWNLELNEEQKAGEFDIIKNSGWVHFVISPDLSTLI
jgi:hypothetical protein